MQLVIVGGGRLVYFLARAMVGDGYRVTVIDGDRDDAAHLARRLGVTVILGDGTDARVLDEAGTGSADLLLAMMPRDHQNLVVCQLARRRFVVPRVFAVVNDPDNDQVFLKLGIDGAFSPIPIIVSLIEQRTSVADVLSLIPMAEGRLSMTEVRVGERAPCLGRPLADLTLPHGVLVATILRGEETIVPHGGTAPQLGDRLIVITQPANHARAIRLLVGP